MFPCRGIKSDGNPCAVKNAKYGPSGTLERLFCAKHKTKEMTDNTPKKEEKSDVKNSEKEKKATEKKTKKETKKKVVKKGNENTVEKAVEKALEKVMSKMSLKESVNHMPTEKKKTLKKRITKVERTAVWDKYIGEHARTGPCFCCGSVLKFSSSEWQCGHYISEFNGGTKALTNLRPICVTCNLDMGTTNMNDYIENRKKFIETRDPVKNTENV